MREGLNVCLMRAPAMAQGRDKFHSILTWPALRRNNSRVEYKWPMALQLYFTV